MIKDIFLCHSKKDIEKIRLLKDSLEVFGYTIWFDENDILPGQRWEQVIDKAIKNSRVLIICLSSSWITSKSYVHKELRIALEIMLELPDENVFVIPIKIDNCEVPQKILHLQYVDLSQTNENFPKLLRILNDVIDPSKITKFSNASREVKDVFGKFIFFNFGTWEIFGRSQEYANLITYFHKGETLIRSYNLLEHKKFKEIIELWKPVKDNPYFDMQNDEVRINDLSLYSLFFSAKIDLCLSYFFYSYENFFVVNKIDFYIIEALKLIKEIINVPVFDISGDVSKPSYLNEAKQKNQEYINYLEAVIKGFTSFGTPLLSDYSGISELEIESLKSEQVNRLKELYKIMK